MLIATLALTACVSHTPAPAADTTPVSADPPLAFIACEHQPKEMRCTVSVFTPRQSLASAVKSVDWDWGTGSPTHTRTAAASHRYGRTGTYTITATVTLTDGRTTVAKATLPIERQ